MFGEALHGLFHCTSGSGRPQLIKWDNSPLLGFMASSDSKDKRPPIGESKSNLRRLGSVGVSAVSGSGGSSNWVYQPKVQKYPGREQVAQAREDAAKKSPALAPGPATGKMAYNPEGVKSLVKTLAVTSAIMGGAGALGVIVNAGRATALTSALADGAFATGVGSGIAAVPSKGPEQLLRTVVTRGITDSLISRTPASQVDAARPVTSINTAGQSTVNLLSLFPGAPANYKPQSRPEPKQ